jgi:hypothetical protein
VEAWIATVSKKKKKKKTPEETCCSQEFILNPQEDVSSSLKQDVRSEA